MNISTTLNDQEPLYRFLSYERLLDYVAGRRFPFTKYKCFKDPWEGFFHKAIFQEDQCNSHSVLGENRQFIMCFTKEKCSDAIWRSYADNGFGAQIVTSPGRLKKLIEASSCTAAFECHLREVTYRDDIQDEEFFVKNFPTKSLEQQRIECLFLKRKAFDYEKEVRLVLCSKADQPHDVHFVDADPNEVIERIVLGPSIDEETEELRIKTLKKLGFQPGTISKSPLYAPPRRWYKATRKLTLNSD